MVLDLLSVVKGGEKIRGNGKYLILLLFFALLIVPVSAEDLNVNLTSSSVDNVFYVEDATVYDYFDMDNIMTEEFSNSTYIFTENLKDYGVLTIEAPNTVFTAKEGVVLENVAFNVKAENVTIENLTIILTESFEDSDGAAVIIQSDNVTLKNNTINFTAPKNMDAYAVYVNGKSSSYINAIHLINNTIYFTANNKLRSVDYGICLYYTPNTLIENNTLISSFPLRDIDYESGVMIGDYVAGICVFMAENLTFTSNNISVDVNSVTLSAAPTLDAVIIKDGKNVYFINNKLSMEDFKTGLGMPNYLYGLDVYNVYNMLIKENNFSIMTVGGIYAAGTAYPIQLTGPADNITITENDIYSISNGPNLGIYSTNYFGQSALKIFNNTINVTGLAGEDDWALVAGIEVQDSNDFIANNTIYVHSTAAVGENDNLFGISYRQKTAGNHTFVIQDNLVFSDSDIAVYLHDSTDSLITDNTVVSSKEGIPDESLTGYKEGDGEHSGDTHYNNRVLNEYTYWSRILNEVDGGEDTTYNTPENVDNITNNLDAKDIDGKNNNPNFDTNPINGSSSDIKPNIPSNNPINHDNGISDDFNENAINPGDEPADNPSSDVNPGDEAKSHDADVINPGDEPADSPENQSVVNPGDEIIDNPGSNTNGNPGDDSIENPYHYDESQKINGTRVDNAGVNDNDGISLPETHNSNVTSNTDSGSKNTYSFNGRSIRANNTQTDSPSDLDQDSEMSFQKSSSSSSMESVGSSNPSSQNSVSKSYEILENIIKSSQNLLLPIILGLILLALFVVGYKRKSNEDEY